MYDYISSVRNQPSFLFTPSALHGLNLHLARRGASEHLFRAIIKERGR